MRTSINIHNLKCGGCAKTIGNKLSSIKGISEIDVDIHHSKVSFNCNTLDDALVVKSTLKSLGYPSKEDKNSFLDRSKSFVSCASGKIS